MLLNRFSKKDAISCNRRPFRKIASPSVWPPAVLSRTQAECRLSAMISGDTSTVKMDSAPRRLEEAQPRRSREESFHVIRQDPM